MDSHFSRFSRSSGNPALPSPQTLTLSICGDVLLAADLLVSAERESIRPHGVTVEALHLLLVAGARPVRPYPRG